MDPTNQPPSPISSQTPVSPPPVPPPMDMARQRKMLFIVMAIACGLILLLTVFLMVRGTKKPTPVTPTPALQPTEAVNTPTPSTPPEPSSGKPWKNQTLSFYNLAVGIPSDWTLTETNRRPAPTGMFAPNKECADYTIKSSAGKTILSIETVCGGIYEGDGEKVPMDAVTLSTGNNDRPLVRFYDTAANAYRYVTVGTSQIMGTNGPETLHTHHGTIEIGSGKNRGEASVRLLSTDAAKPSADILKTADTIVTALAESTDAMYN